MDISKINSEIVSPLKDLHDIQEKIHDAIEQKNKSYERFLSKVLNFNPLKLDFKSPSLDPILINLSAYGWYVSYDVDVYRLFDAQRFLNAGKVKEMDELMYNLQEKRVPMIIDNFNKRFPHRALIINEAYKAYQNQMYYVCIPTFLSQIDGICEDMTNKKFFLNKRKTNLPEVSEWAEGLSDTRKYLIAVLLTKGAFQLHRSELNKINFTRHSVLHGESLDYGSKINALRIISLLGFLDDIFIPRPRR